MSRLFMDGDTLIELADDANPTVQLTIDNVDREILRQYH